MIGIKTLTSKIAEFVKRNWLVLFICVLASVFRLMLSRSMGVIYIHGSGYDDTMMYDKAISIVQGNWLGEYYSMTLAKGVGFPLLAAFISILHIPYSLGFHILYVCSCMVFIGAIVPWLKNRWIGMAAYLFILFCPVAFSAQLVRLYRDMGSYIIALFFISCTIGFFVRVSSLRKALPWAGFAGFTLAFACLYREDSQWLIVYLVACLVVCVVVWILHNTKNGKHKKWYQALCLPLAALLGWGVCTTPVLLLNGAYYGTYVAEDFNSGSFARAFQAIYSIDTGEGENPKVVMTQKKQQLLREVSPAFVEVADFLQYVMTDDWYGTGYFTFALRTAVDSAGYYEDSNSANQFYERMAAEINQAVSDGRLKTDTKGIGISPKFYNWMTWPILEATFTGFTYLLSCSGIDPVPPPEPATNEAAIIQHYEEFTHEQLHTNLQYSDGEVVTVQQRQNSWDAWGQGILRGIVTFYKILLPVLFVLFLFSVVGTTVLALRRKAPPLRLWADFLVPFSLLCLTLLRFAMLAYVQVGSAFNTFNNLPYLSACYPVFCTMLALGGLYVLKYRGVWAKPSK